MPDIPGSPAALQWLRSLAPRAGLEAALFVTGALVCIGLTGYFAVDIHAPAAVRGDHLFLVTMAKSYIDGHGFRFNPNLGYPQSQDLFYFPVFEFTQRSILWLSTRFTRQPFVAVHGYYVIGISLMYGATTWALRWLGVRWQTAAVAAVGYVVAPFLFRRAYGHDFLALYYAAPFGLALALRLGAGPPVMELRRFLLQPFVLVAALVAASSGIYDAFFSLMFVAFAGVAAAGRERSWRPMAVAAALIAPMLVVLALSGFGLDLPAVLLGHGPANNRAAYEQVLYGLDMKAAAVPFRFIPAIRRGIDTTLATTGLDAYGQRIGEWPGAALTLVVLASPLIAAIFLPARGKGSGPLVERRALIGFAAVCATFGLLYAVSGGLGLLFNLLVAPEIRATERITPFLAFAALVAATGVAELTAGSAQAWKRWTPSVLICAALIASSAPWFGGMAAAQARRYALPVQSRLRQSTPPMLAAKDRIGARRILELPMLAWPEASVADPSVDPYEAQLPYIYDRPHSDTRWSYGVAAGQEGFALRSFVLGDTASVARRARAYGYDALLALKTEIPSKIRPGMLAELDRQLGPKCRAYDDAVYALYSLAGACGGGE